MKFPALNICLILLFFLPACDEKEEPGALQSGTKVRLHDGSDKALSNDFTKIAWSLCDDTGREPMTFQNTECYPLDPLDRMRAFMIETACPCGFPMGSCGNDLAIYERDEKGHYSETFNTCGYNAKMLIESNNGIHSFTYESRWDYLHKVGWKNGLFKEETIQFNGMDIAIITAIADTLHQSIESFYLEGSGRVTSIKITIQDFDLAPGKEVTLYTADYWNGPATFLFEEKRMIFMESNVISLEPETNDKNQYPDLKVVLPQWVVNDPDIGYDSNIVHFGYSEQKDRYVLK